MAEERKVVLRRSEHSGFGFSLLGTTGPPHVIYDIVENSPAAECAVEAGDIILKVNGTDVHRYTTKEVLKCLRLSDDLVTLDLKRDPKLKARIKEQLASAPSPHYAAIESQNIYDYRSHTSHTQHTTSSSLTTTATTHHHLQQQQQQHHSPLQESHYLHHETHNSNSNSSHSNVVGSASSPALRYKSPTHLPTTPTGTRAQTTNSTTPSNHSRNSSNSSAKIQIIEANSTAAAATALNSASTSPTCRPSRIPTALKCPQKPPVQHSPQHKRPRPSQIPTKASSVSANGNAPVTISATSTQLQHSNSYSGSGSSTRFQQQSFTQQKERDPDPISAPPQPVKAPRFEAYMMTGDLILNLSRTPQSSNLIPAHAKKIDSLRDSPNRAAAAATARANGALAPRASGESSPTSSSSVESPTQTASSDSVNLHKQQQQKNKTKHRQHQLLQQQRDSINNSYNNSNSGGDEERQYRKDSLTNDTLLLCEELRRDDEEEDDDDDYEGEYDLELEQSQDNNRQQRHLQQQQHQNRQQQRYRRQERTNYEHYRNEEEEDDVENRDFDDDYDDEEEENEEDQTNYDITNIETYNSGGAGAGADASDRQCLVMHYEDDEDGIAGDEEYSNVSPASATAKQRLRALKQKQKVGAGTRHHKATTRDSVDCPRQYYAARGVGAGSGSSSSSTTVRSDGGTGGGGGLGGVNTSPDETSFSVPTSPTSLSTPLIDKETANSVPTSPEPSSLGGAVGGGAGETANVSGVVRRHNGIVRTCDSAGFRTSKSEDHLQQIQREGIAAVIPIDIDEDVNSSLNTLLDTRQDSEDSQPSSNTTSTTTSTTIKLSNSPEVLSQRDIFNKRRRKVRIVIPHIATTTTTTTAADITIHNNANITTTTTTTITTTTTTTTTTIITTTSMTTALTPTKLTTTTTTPRTSPAIFIKKASNRDRIVWTYNAPLPPHILQQQQQQQQQQPQASYSTQYGQNSSPNSHSHSHSSSISSSPQHSAGSPASPTSVSSSVMSSSGSKGALGIGGGASYGISNNGHQQQQQHAQQQLTNANGTLTASATTTAAGTTMGLLQCPINGGGSGSTSITGGGGGGGGDQSVSEAISNISSPDYQDDDNLLSSRDLVGGMILSDPSDSDSTILVSDAAVAQRQQQQQQRAQQSEHKLVIQVRGLDSSNSASPRSAYSELKDSEDELATLTEEPPATYGGGGGVGGGSFGGGVGNAGGDGRESSPPVSDDGSDVESLHSYHYSPKAVDMPSAIRLAKRLYSLDGFKKSDVSRHLSKNNDFSRAVADEYLKYFTFEKKTLDQSLREFLQQFSLSGETQERERVLVHFSKRFLDCNPGTFNSQDAVHTLTCAIMLLNTDLHGQNIGRKMTCAEFVENLAELNDGENFPKDVLKYLYQAIKTQPLEWALDDDATELQKRADNNVSAGSAGHTGQNPFLDIPESSTAVEYKKGYVMRKCCYDSNYKKTPFGKRSWKMFYCTLRDLVLFLHKDEHGFRKSQMSDNLHNAIRIHHALATKATDYTKKQHVFRLQTADQAEYLFQTSDSKELQSWVETINFVCAAYSAPPLEGGVGSQKRFQRPLLPSTHTKFLMKEQLESHEQLLAQLESTLTEHRKGPIPSKGLPLQNYKEKENYLQYEIRRYKAYVSILSAKILADQQQLEMQQLTNNEESDTFPIATITAAAAGVRQQQQLQLQQPQQQQAQPQQQQSANRKKEKKK